MFSDSFSNETNMLQFDETDALIYVEEKGNTKEEMKSMEDDITNKVIK